MKQNIRLLIGVLVLALALLGCQPAATPTPTAEPTVAPTAEPTQETAAMGEGEPVQVALVLDGAIDDQGWNQAGYEGLMAIQEQFENVEVAYSESVAIADMERALRDYASQGYDFIILHSSIAKDAAINTATDYPDIMFLWTDGDTTLDNLAVIRPMSHEASYLAGLIAGSLTKSNIIGMVGGIDIPSTHRSYAGFAQGVAEVNPDAQVLVNWIGSFLDVSAGNEAARSQVEAGADVIFGNGDGQNIGVLTACAETETLAIGAVRDQFEVAPAVVLTSVEWGFSAGIARVFGDYLAGDFTGQFYEISLAEGADLAPYHDNADKIPQEVQDLVDQKRQEIIDGTLVIPVVDFAEE